MRTEADVHAVHHLPGEYPQWCRLCKREAEAKAERR